MSHTTRSEKTGAKLLEDLLGARTLKAFKFGTKHKLKRAERMRQGAVRRGEVLFLLQEAYGEAL